MSVRGCLVLLSLLVALACARPPAALRGDYPRTTVAEAVADAGGRREVRWGGELVATTPTGDRTCFEVVERPLDRAARPRGTDETSGRFLACAAGFYDPALWAPGREMTVVGRLDGTQTGAVGGATYRFPRVDAEAVHLWPIRDPYARTWPAIGIGIGGGSRGVGGGLGIGF
ncbi:MAG: Slp family lipoprotein [bacterium]|nr:Slp family lipoprotein [bacterium]